MTTPLPASEPLDVICLCAQWCGNCRDYLPVFEALRERLSAGVRQSWVDVEDASEVLGEVEIENFPSVLLLRGEVPLFLGPVVPQAAVLLQLVQTAREGRLQPLADLPAQALGRRMRRHLD